MRLATILAAVLLASLSACGSDDESTASEPTSATSNTAASSEATPSPSPVATEEAGTSLADESDDCRVAASTWADRMTKHVLDAATTAPAFGDSLETENLDDPTSQIKVLCSETLSQTVLHANERMATANYELSLCSFTGDGCDAASSKKIRRIAEEAAGLVGTVKQLI